MLAGQCLDACGAAVAVTTVVSGRRDPQASARTWARAPAASRSSRYPPSSTPTTGAGATRARNASVQCATSAGSSVNPPTWRTGRSEEHTSELQSHSDLVCRLLLEKKKYYKGARQRFHASIRVNTLTAECCQ